MKTTHETRYLYKMPNSTEECLCIIEHWKAPYDQFNQSLDGIACIIESPNRRYKPSELYNFDEKCIIAKIPNNATLADMKKNYPEYYL